MSELWPQLESRMDSKFEITVSSWIFNGFFSFWSWDYFEFKLSNFERVKVGQQPRHFNILHHTESLQNVMKPKYWRKPKEILKSKFFAESLLPLSGFPPRRQWSFWSDFRMFQFTVQSFGFWVSESGHSECTRRWPMYFRFASPCTGTFLGARHN